MQMTETSRQLTARADAFLAELDREDASRAARRKTLKAAAEKEAEDEDDDEYVEGEVDEDPDMLELFDELRGQVRIP